MWSFNSVIICKNQILKLLSKKKVIDKDKYSGGVRALINILHTHKLLIEIIMYLC